MSRTEGTFLTTWLLTQRALNPKPQAQLRYASRHQLTENSGSFSKLGSPKTVRHPYNKDAKTDPNLDGYPGGQK